jgi:hypothetical protein
VADRAMSARRPGCPFRHVEAESEERGQRGGDQQDGQRPATPVRQARVSRGQRHEQGEERLLEPREARGLVDGEPRGERESDDPDERGPGDRRDGPAAGTAHPDGQGQRGADRDRDGHGRDGPGQRSDEEQKAPAGHPLEHRLGAGRRGGLVTRGMDSWHQMWHLARSGAMDPLAHAKPRGHRTLSEGAWTVQREGAPAVGNGAWTSFRGRGSKFRGRAQSSWRLAGPLG